ncbi:MAG TPA: nickel pincer cofactor biosynthesis protein LarC, partial [Actinomycetota bacterium]|nr:nickel pincer cofactor biosynthesis protein LarC [Actinomycetota bacterium]
MKVIYFDCFSGAAGDMILGGLVDAGASMKAVIDNVNALGLSDASLSFETANKNGLRATKARVTTEARTRSSPEITALLSEAPLDPAVRDLVNKVFDVLVDAEATAHGTSAQTVHLHEAGSDDALIDVVGSCAALLSLEPELVVTSPLPTGGGFVESAHGRLPVPVPAVVHILKGLPLVSRGGRELVTPTGASFLKAVSHRFGDMPDMILDSIGYGAGDQDDELPNVVRVMIGEGLESHASSDVVLLETNIDDMAPELFPFVIERLMASGAHDAWATPILMKKHRAAFTLSVLCATTDR